MYLNFQPKSNHLKTTSNKLKLLIFGASALSCVMMNTVVFAASATEKENKISRKKVVDTTVKGKITDEKGETLVGVVIKVKNTSIVTTTDANGAFSITIPSTVTDPVLVVSYIGYTSQEVPVGGKTAINIQLKSAINDLDEIVIVGYNAVKKSDLTGSVVSVGAEEIRSRPVTNALQAIQGKAAGVDITSNERPGQIGSILIRGVRSINASNSPLYVVDGIPLQAGGIEAINPNDIEAIDILKDASATAIYGSRGANGVVLVTTKQGKVGRLTLDYVGTATIETLNDRTEMMNSGQYIEFRRDAYRRTAYLNSINGTTTAPIYNYPTVATQANDQEIC